MIKSILICDSQGYPFYMKQIDPTMTEMDSSIFSGLISAISTIGKQLFNEDIATITYGDKYKITIITKELISYQKTIYFVSPVPSVLNDTFCKSVNFKGGGQCLHTKT